MTVQRRSNQQAMDNFETSGYGTGLREGLMISNLFGKLRRSSSYSDTSSSPSGAHGESDKEEHMTSDKPRT